MKTNERFFHNNRHAQTCSSGNCFWYYLRDTVTAQKADQFEMNAHNAAAAAVAVHEEPAAGASSSGGHAGPVHTYFVDSDDEEA